MGVCSEGNPRKKNINFHDYQGTTQNQLNNKNNHNNLNNNPNPERIINRLSKNSKFENINDFYNISQKFLGKGATGIVREAKDKSGKKFAIKTVWKSDIEQNECFKREINISLLLDNEFIVKCQDIFEDNISIHFVLELMEGGDLFDHIIHSEGKKLKENEAVDLLSQILQGLQYLHQEIGIVHRDIKPENFLLCNEGGRNKIKLIDFGFATFCKSEETMTEQLGTPQYAAPEIYKEEPYTNKVDMWSVGVVLYNMIKGTQPFSSKGDIKEQVLNKQIDFSCFQNPSLKDLCQNLLERNPEHRFNAYQAFQALKLVIDNQQNDGTAIASFKPDINKIINILYNDRTIIEELKNIFLSECTENELEKMYKEIIAMSSDNNNSKISESNFGIISDKLYMKVEKLIEYCNHSNYCSDDLKQRLKKYTDQKVIGKIRKQMINIHRFFITTIESIKFIRKLRVLNEFQKIDKENYGWISESQLEDYFIDPIKRNNIKTKIEKNQRIEFETFYKISNEYDGIKVTNNFKRMNSKHYSLI